MSGDGVEAMAAARSALRRLWNVDALELTDMVELSGSQRSVVVRATVQGSVASGVSVIVKAYDQRQHSTSTIGPGQAWGNEVVAATLLGELPTRLGPRLITADRDTLVLVFEDLGQHPALADLLLADEPESAESALIEWAAGLGQVAALTRGCRQRLERLHRSLGLSPPGNPMDGYLRAGAADLVAMAKRGLNIPPPRGVEDDVARIIRLLEPSEFDVLSPGDVCPDNNQITAAGVRFFDLEFAGCSSLFLDAAYTISPFPTCWCVLDLPDTVAERAAEAYRAAAVASFPRLADDRLWWDGLTRACALWTATRTCELLRNLPDDPRRGSFVSHGVRFPGAVAQICLRISRYLKIAGEALPALSALMQTIRDRLVAEYGPASLTMPTYPAFERRIQRDSTGSIS